MKLKSEQQGLVVVVNKSDLERILTGEMFEEKIGHGEVIETSAVKGEGIDLLEKAVTGQLDKLLGHSEEATVMVTLRHKKILEEALLSLNEAKEEIHRQPPEIISLSLQQAWQKLGEISGETINEDLLDHIFSEFCLGK